MVKTMFHYKTTTISSRDRRKRINKRQTKEAVKKVVEKIKNEKYANQMINYQRSKVHRCRYRCNN